MTRTLCLILLTLGVSRDLAAAPLVFDFESGTGGWTLGSPTRVPGSPLGGEFAIFGQGSSLLPGDLANPPSMWIQLDLTGYASLTFSQLSVVSAPVWPNLFVQVFIQPVPAGPGSFLPGNPGSSLLATPEAPYPNPDVRRVDLSAYQGIHTVSFVWISVNETGLSGYVDDITLHPVPEPSSAALLLMGLTLLPALARRIWSS